MTRSEVDGGGSGVELLHRRAIAAHLVRADGLLAADPAITDELRIAVCDALTWAVNLRWEVNRIGIAARGAPARPDRRDLDHIGLGAYWARNQISHGRADVLQLARGTLDEGARYDAELPYDMHMPWNASPEHPLVRFVKVPGSVARDEDRYGIQRFYNACVAGRSVIELCALLQLPSGTHRSVQAA